MVSVAKSRANLVPHSSGAGAAGSEQSVTAELAADSGLVFLENMDVPTEVQPGSNVPISVDVRNDAQLINAFDPDFCIAPNLFNGYRLGIVARVNGFEVDRIRRCIAQRQVRDVQLQVRAPTTEGPFELTLEVVGGNTGHFQDDISQTIQVSETAAPQPCPPGFERDPNTGECVIIDDGGGNGNGDGDDDIFDDLESILTLLVVFGALVLLSGATSRF